MSASAKHLSHKFDSTGLRKSGTKQSAWSGIGDKIAGLEDNLLMPLKTNQKKTVKSVSEGAATDDFFMTETVLEGVFLHIAYLLPWS